jgi:hypothetical protein
MFEEEAQMQKTKWHKVADGDFPKGENIVLIYWKAGDMECFSVVEPYKVQKISTLSLGAKFQSSRRIYDF